MTTARDIYRTHPTQREIDDVLAGRHLAALGTRNEDGSIHLTYLLFLYEGGRFHLETSSVTRKARNISRDGIASILVQGRAATGRNLMVEAEGAARIVELPEAQAINHRLRAKYIVPDAVEAIDVAWAQIDDVAIEVMPQRWRSWTGSLLAETTAAAIGRGYGEIWLPD